MLIESFFLFLFVIKDGCLGTNYITAPLKIDDEPTSRTCTFVGVQSIVTKFYQEPKVWKDVKKVTVHYEKIDESGKEYNIDEKNLLKADQRGHVLWIVLSDPYPALGNNRIYPLKIAREEDEKNVNDLSFLGQYDSDEDEYHRGQCSPEGGSGDDNVWPLKIAKNDNGDIAARDSGGPIYLTKRPKDHGSEIMVGVLIVIIGDGKSLKPTLTKVIDDKGWFEKFEKDAIDSIGKKTDDKPKGDDIVPPTRRRTHNEQPIADPETKTETKTEATTDQTKPAEEVVKKPEGQTGDNAANQAPQPLSIPHEEKKSPDQKEEKVAQEEKPKDQKEEKAVQEEKPKDQETKAEKPKAAENEKEKTPEKGPEEKKIAEPTKEKEVEAPAAEEKPKDNEKSTNTTEPETIQDPRESTLKFPPAGNNGTGKMSCYNCNSTATLFEFPEDFEACRKKGNFDKQSCWNDDDFCAIEIRFTMSHWVPKQTIERCCRDKNWSKWNVYVAYYHTSYSNDEEVSHNAIILGVMKSSVWYMIKKFFEFFFKWL